MARHWPPHEAFSFTSNRSFGVWIFVTRLGQLKKIKPMLSFLRKYQQNIIYSQNGEEGILLECVKRLNMDENCSAVEIGGNDGRYCSNTALLAERCWRVKFVESDFNLWKLSTKNWENHPNVSSQCSHVDKYNIAAFVTPECNILSLDTDGSDYHLFAALKCKPMIAIVEIDSSIKPPSEDFNKDGGASYMTMLKLGISKGYFLLCHTGNMVFIANELRESFPEIIGDGIENWEEYFNTAWLAK